MKKKLYISRQMILALGLSTVALQVSAGGPVPIEYQEFHSNLSIEKEGACRLAVTASGASAAARYDVKATSGEIDFNAVPAVTVKASGEESCQLGTIALSLQHQNTMNGSSALISASKSSRTYIPFDFALGPIQVTGMQGEEEDRFQVNDRLTVTRHNGKIMHPLLTMQSTYYIANDEFYHGHGKTGQRIIWGWKGDIYVGSDNIPFWPGEKSEIIKFNGKDARSVTFNLVPAASFFPYLKDGGQRGRRSDLDISDVYSDSAVVTVSTI